MEGEIMSVTEAVWQERLTNLNEIWRKSDRPSKQGPAGDYASHLKKVFLGFSIIDLGCGDAKIKTLISSKHEYIGVDPLPLSPDIIQAKAEDLNFSADTILCFAMLDGCQDLEKTLQAINRHAKYNVVILTGLGIEPDMFHTHAIAKSDILTGLPDFKIRYEEEVSPNVWLFDFWRKR
jgi:hypothetical protein